MHPEIAEFLPNLLLVYSAFILAVLSPGPNILAIVGLSMGTSRRAGVMTACGISTGTFIWATLAVTGVTALLAAFAWFGYAIRILGGLYLLWIASKYIRAAIHHKPISVDAKKSDKNDLSHFMQGFGVQITNPKAILYWLAIVSVGISPNAPLWVMLAIVIGCVALAFIGHIAWALLFSTKPVVSFYQKFKKWFDGTIGALLGALGLGLILSAFRRGN